MLTPTSTRGGMPSYQDERDDRHTNPPKKIQNFVGSRNRTEEKTDKTKDVKGRSKTSLQKRAQDDNYQMNGKQQDRSVVGELRGRLREREEARGKSNKKVGFADKVQKRSYGNSSSIRNKARQEAEKPPFQGHTLSDYKALLKHPVVDPGGIKINKNSDEFLRALEKKNRMEALAKKVHDRNMHLLSGDDLNHNKPEQQKKLRLLNSLQGNQLAPLSDKDRYSSKSPTPQKSGKKTPMHGKSPSPSPIHGSFVTQNPLGSNNISTSNSSFSTKIRSGKSSTRSDGSISKFGVKQSENRTSRESEGEAVEGGYQTAYFPPFPTETHPG